MSPSTLDLDQIAAVYSEDLYRFAWSLAGRTADAEDLVQQTLLRYAQKSHTIRDGESVRPWLFTVLHREHLKVVKKANRYCYTSLENAMDTPSTDSTATDVDTSVDHQTVITALEKMDEHLCAPLVLFYLKQLKYREIAEILQVPIGTVMSRIARAKAALRTALGVSLNPLSPDAV